MSKKNEIIKKHGLMRSLMENQFSMQFLTENADLFDATLWKVISSYQELTEEFIERFENEVYWPNICQNQVLSTEFIQNNLDKISLQNIGPHNKLPFDFIKENLGNLKFLYLIASRHWHYEQVETLWDSFKKQDFYIYFKDKYPKAWVGWKIDEIKERTIFKLSNGSQLEIPFIYPYYKPNIKLRDSYSRRIEFNLNLLKSFLEDEQDYLK